MLSETEKMLIILGLLILAGIFGGIAARLGYLEDARMKEAKNKEIADAIQAEREFRRVIAANYVQSLRLADSRPIETTSREVL